MNKEKKEQMGHKWNNNKIKVQNWFALTPTPKQTQFSELDIYFSNTSLRQIT